MSVNQIIYVTDPLCLWCYGISPSLAEFTQQLPDDIEWLTLNGGLFPAAQAKKADQGFRDYLKSVSDHVTERTGQEFSRKFWDLLETEGFYYDTEPAARAVVAIKNILGEEVVGEYIHALQKAVFVEGENPNSLDVLSEIAGSFNVDAERFKEEYLSQTCLKSTHAEYALTKQLGISGFPAVIYIHEGKGFQLAAGYASTAELNKAFDWARKELGQPLLADSAKSCDLEHGCT